MRNIFLTILCFLLLIACQREKKNQSFPSTSPNPQADSLELALSAYANMETLPGFGVSIFTADSILFEKGFGYSNLVEKDAFQTDHIQIIASISKTLVGVALMKAVEDGLLGLDDDINAILPFQIRNPHFPDKVITPRMLAAHTSSISGTKQSDKGYRFESPLLAAQFPDAYQPLLENYNQTAEITLADFLAYKLNPTGKWYEPNIYLDQEPGSVYEYSNIGIALLAHLIELKTNIPFDQYTQDLILAPLKMNASTWDINKVPLGKHTTYYNELYQVVPKYYIITYPDGGLYSSISDLRLFAQEMMKGYAGESDLLSEASFKEMMKKQFEGDDLNDGLCWDLSFGGLIGHSGNDFGTATLMYFSPSTGIGRILFTNISIETEAQEEVFYDIYNTLFAYNFGQ